MSSLSTANKNAYGEEWPKKKLCRTLLSQPCYGVLVPDYIDEGVPMLRINDIENGHASKIELKKISAQQSQEYSRSILQIGDIAISVVGTIGRTLLVDKGIEGCNLSRAVARVTPDRKKLNPTFLRWSLESLQFKSYTDLNCTGTAQKVLNLSTLSSYLLACPPLHRQKEVSIFLDRETAKIDALIAEQERLIELLQEKRQAVISHAVTKGLNPDAPMKDSGVEWLGEVPEHWEVKALKRLSPKQTVGIVVNPSSYISDEGLPFIYGGDIREEVIDIENCRKISREDSLSQPKTILEGEDLITVRVGAPGVTAVVPEAAAGGNCASVMLTKKGAFESRWLCYLMNSRPYRHQVEIVQYGAAQEQFNISHAVEFICPTPPIAEQKEIADYLLKECQAIDQLSEQVKMSIVLMQERRSALISAAVTGQIDVRGLDPEEEVGA